MSSSLPYRKNVAAFVIKGGLILTCQRTDKNPDWQLPQGGIDSGETPIHALQRELKEEIYLVDFSIACEIPHPISYEWPERLHARGFRGQEQYFYVVSPKDQTWVPVFNTHTQIEFNDFKWLTASEFTMYVKHTFRAESYLKALDYITINKPNLIES